MIKISFASVHSVRYFFKDKRALTMLPLPGCEIKMSGERNSFTVRHMQRMYTMTVDDEDKQIKWMAVLDLAANAALREKTKM